MTFDTFESYNTDEAYKDKGTTAKGLVAAYKKDNPEGTKEDFYSKLNKTWAEDKDGHVKNAVNEAFKVDTPKAETAPKTEEKKETTVEKILEQEETPTTTSKISDKDKSFLESESAISENSEDAENKRQNELEQRRWNATNDRMKKSGEAFGNIDDKMVAQLPTFMFKRFKDGEFGDPKSSDAKLRLAYFMINGVQSKLKNASNAAAMVAGRSPMFSDTTSDYEKYQQTNFAQGLENRWNKYKQETQAAIDLAKDQGEDEQELQSSIAKISSNARLQTAFNMMNENEKVYTLRVLSKIGNEIGNMSNKDFVNTLIGYATSGDNLTWQEAAELLVARFGKDALGAIKNANDDGATNGGEDKTAGIGGGIGNNLKGYQTIDGETLDFNMIEDKDKKDKLRSLMDDLSARYYNEQIDEATFRKYYEPLYTENKRHLGTGSNSTDKRIELNKKNKKADLNDALNELNDQARAGNISPKDYAEQFDNIKANFKKWGLGEKELARVEKSRISQEKILKNVDKANKKK